MEDYQDIKVLINFIYLESILIKNELIVNLIYFFFILLYYK